MLGVGATALFSVEIKSEWGFSKAHTCPFGGLLSGIGGMWGKAHEVPAGPSLLPVGQSRENVADTQVPGRGW